MKTPWLISVVIAAHFVAVGAIFMIQGCGTLTGPVVVEPPPEPVMPPTQVEQPQPAAQLVVPGPRQAKRWPAETTTYVVGKGESLSEIAFRYGLTVKEIAALNGISNPDLIRSGQKIILPGKVDIDRQKPMKSAPQQAVTVADGSAYVVKAGDTLSEIAAQFGVKTADLKSANGLTADKIMVGQKLVIPGGAVKPSAAAPTQAPSPVAVPEKPAAAAPSKPVAASPEATVASEPKADAAGDADPTVKIHVVEEDEDLYSVAMMWGVSVARIKELNGLTDIHLKPGQRLKIPISE
jgi:LysM repeat protein